MGGKIVIIGGVAAGAGAATKARRESETAEIIMLEKGEYVSFANCGLPYYVGEQIKQREKLILITPQRFKERFNIDVRINNEAVAIDPMRKVVKVRRNDSEEYEESYDTLIIATGNAPVKPKLPGIELEHIFNLWTVPDVDKIKGLMSKGKPRHAVVVGAGFIGIEAVENLLHVGVQVTLVEKFDHVMPPLDEEMALILEKHLSQKGVRLITGKGVQAFLGEGAVSGVRLEDGSELPADMVIVAIGAAPQVEIARQAGIRMGDLGGIFVDEYMRTSTSDIYAAGDIVESLHLVSGERVRIPLAGPANKQGRVAGANAAGAHMKFKGVVGTMIVKACDLTAAKTGLGEAELQRLGWHYKVSYTYSPSHATYYPGAQMMVVKVLFREDDGLLLGAQIVGPEGVDKRIDVFATALYSGHTVADLEDLDLAYAPPFGSAKDPVIMAGMVAGNIYRQQVKNVTIRQLEALMATEPRLQIIDVRTKAEYDKGHVPGAINIPIDEFRAKLDQVGKNKVTALYCGVGYRSYLAFKILEHNGFADLYNVSGGYACWTAFSREQSIEEVSIDG